ncbi:MAG: DUF192 domain-containing protein [Parerythrobacter sp.]
MKTLTRLLAVLSAAALASCSPQTGTDSASAEPVMSSDVHPESGLETVPLTVTSGDTTHDFTVEIATTPAEQSKGLMFRTQLGPNEGMIFPRDPPDLASFWMKNVPIPLDIIFVGADGRIINIAAMTTPYSLDSVSSEGPTALVLELRGGRAAELGIEAGDRVAY